MYGGFGPEHLSVPSDVHGIFVFVRFNMNDLMKFEFEGKGVRTVLKDGEPWFVAKDVCDILDLTQTAGVLRRIPEKQKGVQQMHTLGGIQNLSIISEAGLYRLVLRSDKPQAEPFIDWVTAEVLPQIRKTGRYEAPAASLLPEEIAMRKFKVYHEFVQIAGIEGHAALVSADNTLYREEGISLLQVTQIELKTEDQEQIFTPTKIGEILGFEGHRGAKKVNKLLSYLDFQERVGDSWVVTEEGKPYAVILDTGKKHKSGTMVQQIKWKESVIPKLEKLLDDDDD